MQSLLTWAAQMAHVTRTYPQHKTVAQCTWSNFPSKSRVQCLNFEENTYEIWPEQGINSYTINLLLHQVFPILSEWASRHVIKREKIEKLIINSICRSSTFSSSRSQSSIFFSHMSPPSISKRSVCRISRVQILVRTFLSSGYSNKLWAPMISGSFGLSEERIRESTMLGLTLLSSGTLANQQHAYWHE